MNQLANKIKEFLLDRWIIIKTSTVSSTQIELAYSANNWGNIISTVVYTLTSLLFINVLYSNVRLFAGYSRDEMPLFFLLGQIAFYSEHLFSFKNISLFVSSVNSGSLDLLLTKPLPALFYINFRTFNIVSTIRDVMPNVILIALNINWVNLNIQSPNLILGILIFLLGLIIILNYHLIIALQVFWIGYVKSLLDLGVSVEDNISHQFPFESVKKYFGIFFIILLPMILIIGGAVSVILGKQSARELLILSVIIAILFSQIKAWVWKRGIKAYNSASS